MIHPFLKVFEKIGVRGKKNFFQKVFLPPMSLFYLI